ncbi:MAG: VWA domain-containing protein [Chloroherpetonaceae bacterium]|nr:VWA domain-containing protein [Chthonomonadaceae bacterium]MDW8207776.1 VWA domain-containing protein [Chloroherpetonaceae bacterium]
MPVQVANLPFLLLLPVLGFFCWWAQRRTFQDLSPARRRAALILRLAVVALLVLALAGARWVRKHDALAVLFVADTSASILPEQRKAMEAYLRDALRGMRQNDRAGLITFAERPHTRALPGPSLEPVIPEDPGPATATNIAQALRLARSELEALARDHGRRIVLLSDGNENAGRALSEVPGLNAAGIVLDTVTLPAPRRAEALVERVVLPAHVRVGEPFPVRVVITTRTAQTARITLTRNGRPATSVRSVDLQPGRNVITFAQSVDRSGIVRYAATLDAPEDSIQENNRGEGIVMVRGRPVVLYVSDRPGESRYLRQALARRQITVDAITPESFPNTVTALLGYDGVLFSNAPRFAFSDAQLDALHTAVRDFGTGFLMIGGEQSYGTGAYRQSVLEQMLPVSMDIRNLQRFPPVAVATAIDRSGSMAEGSPRSKLELAREAAVRTVRALKPGDAIAVITFEDTAEVRVPLTPVEKADQIVAEIQKITIGGGTSVYSGVRLAYETIRGARAPIKHLIILTDGMSQDPDYTALINGMRAHRITATGVVIGAGTRDIYTHDLARVARATGGRFYVVQHERQIPGIYLQEVERISSSPIVEGAFLPRPTDRTVEILPGGMPGSSPPLLGYNVTRPKPTADVLLVSPARDPILATWRYGLGRVAAFTSDDRNRWATHWLGWSGYTRFWTELVRWTLRASTPDAYTAQVTVNEGRGHLVIETADHASLRVDRSALRAQILMPARQGSRSGGVSDVREESLHRIGPGRYEAWFDVPETGTYLVHVWRQPAERAQETVAVLGLSVPYAPEYRDIRPNEALMSQLAQTGGGRHDPAPASVFGADRPAARVTSDLTLPLLFAALFLFPLDIAVRRLTFGLPDLLRAWHWLRTRASRTTPATSSPLARLRERKAATQNARGAMKNAPDAGPLHPASLSGSSGTAQPDPAPAVTARAPRKAPEESAASPDGVAGAGASDSFSRLLAARRRAQQRQDRGSRS